MGSSPISVANPMESFLDVLKALLERRSIGKLAGDVGDEHLATLLEAAVCAPNHHLTQPWRFTVVRGEARRRLGDAWARIAAKALPAAAEARDARLDKERGKLLRAPIVIVASVRTDRDPVVAAEDFAATAAAVQNILLAAVALGLGAMWRTGEMAYSAEFNAELGIAADDRVVAFVYVGEAASVPKTPDRTGGQSVVKTLS